ncbi:uncharacterized oxidoreductase At4g09670-like [Camellia sinensis]|uniref:uncharacterized oxidoreductase At4g09670-like n=1 Tax=Camellia sinensis TaxID=4442 RepID=UPI001035675A|nr:uncharacterized oxidoreductase At4g09670-like [Camellia sinensis]
MDATMWMHHPRTAKMKEFLAEPERFGKLKSVHSIFSYDGGPDFLKTDIRVKPDLHALGCLGDTGWCCTRAILWAADYELPKTVTALHKPEFNEAGVIMTCGASLSWGDGKGKCLVARSYQARKWLERKRGRGRGRGREREGEEKEKGGRGRRSASQLPAPPSS